MTPGQLLNKAEHAILTGQPNLAMIYLRRAEEILDQRAAAHMRWKLGHAVAGLGRALQALPRHFEDAARAIGKMIGGYNDYYDRVFAEIEAEWDRV